MTAIALASLDPSALADEVWGWVVAHVGRLIGYDDMTDVQQARGRMHVRHSVAVLCHYAQHGGALDAHPADYVQSVAEILWTAVHPAVYSDADTIADARGEPTEAIDVVLRAALCRDALSGPADTVPIAWLAALGGVSVQTARTYQGRGVLGDVEAGQVLADAARRWLASRNVPGFGPHET